MLQRRTQSVLGLLAIVVCRRPKQEEIEMSGAGVAPAKDKKLEEWADDYVEKRDAKAVLAEDMTALEAKMLDRMQDKGIEIFRFADKELKVKPGKTHVKIKTVKSEGQDADSSGNGAEESTE